MSSFLFEVLFMHLSWANQVYNMSNSPDQLRSTYYSGHQACVWLQGERLNGT